MAKYRITDNTKKCAGRTLHQIEAMQDIPRFGIAKGELGGWIESENNLSQTGDAWVSGDAWEQTPPYVAISPFNMCMPTKSTLKVGCQEHTFAKWRKIYSLMAKRHEIQGEKLNEYIHWFNAFVMIHGDKVPIEIRKEG